MNNHKETVDQIIKLKNQKYFCAIFQLEDSNINLSSGEEDPHKKLILKVHPDKNIKLYKNANAVEKARTNEALRTLTELKKGNYELAKINTTDVF